jgi:diguanylate cyclase (GGDEF)-like protein
VASTLPHHPRRVTAVGPLLPVATVAGVGLTLWNRRLTARLRRRAVVAEAVADLSQRALSADQPDALLREALRVAVEVTGADYGTAVRRLPDGRMRVAQELGPEPLPPGTILPLAPQRSYVMRIVETGEPFVSADLRADPRVTPPASLLARGVVSGLAVPVRGAQSVVGVLAVHSRRSRRFGADDMDAVCQLAAVVATAWEQAAQHERLGHQALHDPLTGLPNRTLFLDRLEHALARRPPSAELGREGDDARAEPGRGADVAVVLIDLDDFKAVNDTFGHAAGDHLLTVAARRFREVVRPHDTLSRLGGDEFVLLFDPVPDEAAALRLAHRLHGACAEPVVVGGSTLPLSASVGVTWTGGTPPEARTAAGLLSEADAALYGAKEGGRGRVQLFDEGLRRSTRRRRELEAELEDALARDEFRLHYQPVRRVGDLRTAGVEALVRWQHPERGLLAPGQFIPTAERTGLLVALGEWVLRTACRWAASDQRAWPPSPGAAPWVSVNVSPRQLDDPRLPVSVADVLAETGLPPARLALELTESAILAGDDDHHTALSRLRDTGVHLFLDDFGTGYSSLTHLTQLPIQAVKIDRSFVAGLPHDRRDAAVVHSLVSLGGELGLDVVAEGVETAQQLDALRAMGCPAVQGFLLDRPLAEPVLGLPRSGADGPR